MKRVVEVDDVSSAWEMREYQSQGKIETSAKTASIIYFGSSKSRKAHDIRFIGRDDIANRSVPWEE